MALALASMTGCGESSVSQNTSSTAKTATSVSDTKESVTAEKSTEYSVDESDEAIEVKQLSNETEETTYTQRDLEQTADTSDAQNITVADGQIIDITSEGVYTISGSAANCTIRINAEDTAKVQLVLDGVYIENEDFPAIYVLTADKVFITTTDTDNTLSVSGQFTADGENNTDAVIYSKDDLVLNGTGTLNVTSNYGNGITSKDDMKITGGTYNVTSALDAFEANDSISVNDGIFNVITNKDGFHCENDEAEGTITISGGTFTINGESDGIQACAVLQIDGGTLDITAPEGL
ncbi:MAG TPA: carbohydrate-binding domain-containing protein, partial [Ruminococcus flavefaciens]|nr:carbohydrate-binding domain-containing protein [Ruminococcus flavefaciens]